MEMAREMEKGNKVFYMKTACSKRKRMSIATVWEHFSTFAIFVTPLLSHCALIFILLKLSFCHTSVKIKIKCCNSYPMCDIFKVNHVIQYPFISFAFIFLSKSTLSCPCLFIISSITPTNIKYADTEVYVLCIASAFLVDKSWSNYDLQYNNFPCKVQ